MQAVLPGMKDRAKGSIINMASTAGKWGSRNQSAYNVSKHALVGLTRCVALEVAASGVRVNAICPGFVQTDMVEDLKRGYAQVAGVDIEKVGVQDAEIRRNEHRAERGQSSHESEH